MKDPWCISRQSDMHFEQTGERGGFVLFREDSFTMNEGEIDTEVANAAKLRTSDLKLTMSSCRPDRQPRVRLLRAAVNSSPDSRRSSDLLDQRSRSRRFLPSRTH